MRELVINRILDDIESPPSDYTYKHFFKSLGFKTTPPKQDLRVRLDKLADEELLAAFYFSVQSIYLYR